MHLLPFFDGVASGVSIDSIVFLGLIFVALQRPARVVVVSCRPLHERRPPAVAPGPVMLDARGVL